MRLVSYYREGEVRLGALQDGRVVDLHRAHRLLQQRRPHAGPAVLPTTVREYLTGGIAFQGPAQVALDLVEDLAQHEGAETLRHWGVAYAGSEVVLKAAVPDPQKIICLGHNYREHVEESGNSIPEVPVLFTKYPNTLIGPREAIVLPSVSHKVDYEAELAFVIGRRGRYIQAAEAMDYVAGYATFNDVSARDFQSRTSQWTVGKTFDRFGPMGPLVTRDEVPDPHVLDIELRLNGEVMQRSNTRNFIFTIPDIVAYISQVVTLEPGDVIATGTPSGVGAFRKPPVFLKPGDLVEVEIASVGRLENPVVAEDRPL